MSNKSNVSELYHSFSNAQAVCAKYNPNSVPQVMANLNDGFKLSLHAIDSQPQSQQQTKERSRIGYNFRSKGKCTINIALLPLILMIYLFKILFILHIDFRQITNENNNTNIDNTIDNNQSVTNEPNQTINTFPTTSQPDPIFANINGSLNHYGPFRGHFKPQQCTFKPYRSPNFNFYEFHSKYNHHNHNHNKHNHNHNNNNYNKQFKTKRNKNRRNRNRRNRNGRNRNQSKWRCMLFISLLIISNECFTIYF